MDRNKVKDYMYERGASRGGGLEQVKRECMDRERLRIFYHGHLLGGMFQEGERHQREIVRKISLNFLAVLTFHEQPVQESECIMPVRGHACQYPFELLIKCRS